jgi:hypothetical protein
MALQQDALISRYLHGMQCQENVRFYIISTPSPLLDFLAASKRHPQQRRLVWHTHGTMPLVTQMLFSSLIFFSTTSAPAVLQGRLGDAIVFNKLHGA